MAGRELRKLKRYELIEIIDQLQERLEIQEKADEELKKQLEEAWLEKKQLLNLAESHLEDLVKEFREIIETARAAEERKSFAAAEEKESPGASEEKDFPAAAEAEESLAAAEEKESPAASEEKESPGASEEKDFPAAAEAEESLAAAEEKESPAAPEEKESPAAPEGAKPQKKAEETAGAEGEVSGTLEKPEPERRASENRPAYRPERDRSSKGGKGQPWESSIRKFIRWIFPSEKRSDKRRNG